MSTEVAAQVNSKILVLGNLAYETALIPDAGSEKDMFRKYSEWVGAITIEEMLNQALTPAEDDRNRSHLLAEIYPTVDHLNLNDAKDKCAEIWTIFDEFQRRSDGSKTDTVWRVERNYRTWPRAGMLEFYNGYLRKCFEACPAPNIVAIYDQDPKFREAFTQAKSTGLLTSPSNHQHISALIVAFADDVDQALIKAAKDIFDTKTTIVLLTANGLRRAGLNIVAYGSIEQTVQEINGCLLTSPLRELLSDCSHLVILLEETGAVCITNTNGQRGSIHFCPNFDRVAQMDKGIHGRSPGKTAIALTAVTRAVCEWRATSEGESLNLEPSLRLAVVAYNRMFDEGFDVQNPFFTVQAVLSSKEQKKLEAQLTPGNLQEEFLLSSLSFPTDSERLKEWSRLDEVPDSDIALKIVLNGVKEACRDYSAKASHAQLVWWPASQITCPFMQIGKFQTFDRDEIERLADLAKLMRKYHDDSSWNTPLSIAVFGPPGAGKSFVVKQLMKAINPTMKESSILTFNLAQFDSLELLTEAFHQVQDQALSSDDVPLIIFDEFDSSFQVSPLGWLKYFLAPMEDGVFRGQTANYKVGRAVFLFAGGTAEKFELFAQPAVEPSRTKIDEKAVKLPDFASRLMAHLDILGINPPKENNKTKTESDKESRRRRVRRATLLRSLLIECAPTIIAPDEKANIAREVVEAFLNNNVFYKNQARSMKAIVRGAHLIGKRFLVGSLPSRDLINQHTTCWPCS